MSFFNSIKRAFGVSDDNDTFDYEMSRNSYVNPFRKENNSSSAQGKDHQDQQPNEDYAIDAEFADRAAQLMNQHAVAVAKKIEQQWLQEKERLLKQVKQAQEQVAAANEKMKAHDAQRRSAMNKANDLTNKIATMQSEQEQSNIQNKSLQNKIKALEVKGDGTEKMTQEINRLNGVVADLRKQLDQARQQPQQDNAKLVKEMEALKQQNVQKTQQCEELTKQLNDCKEQLDDANANLEAAELLKDKIEEVEVFKEKKNAEIASLRQQITEMQKRTSEYDEMRKKLIVAENESAKQQKAIDELNQMAKQNAEVQNRRNIDTGNQIDDLKQQLNAVAALAEDYKARLNAVYAQGNEATTKVERLTQERDDAKAELKQTQQNLEKAQHEVQAVSDALSDKDRQIAQLKAQLQQHAEKTAKIAALFGSSITPEQPAEPAPAATEEPSADSKHESDDALDIDVSDIDNWPEDRDDENPDPDNTRQLSIF